MRPGEGYLFRRMAPGTVNIRFYNRNAMAAPRRASSAAQDNRTEFTNPQAATNMTMIARLENEKMSKCENEQIRVYVNDELAAVAEPMDSLYFITIQSD